MCKEDVEVSVCVKRPCVCLREEAVEEGRGGVCLPKEAVDVFVYVKMLWRCFST